jgi:glycine hydroxymethyltransferase
MMLAALPERYSSAGEAEGALERAHIAVNGLPLPWPGGQGLRLGTPAVTTRGFGTAEIDTVAEWVADVLDEPSSAAVIGRVREGVRELCGRFPVYA